MKLFLKMKYSVPQIIVLHFLAYNKHAMLKFL